MKRLKVIPILALMVYKMQAFASENTGLDVLASVASMIAVTEMHGMQTYGSSSSLSVHTAPTIEAKTKEPVSLKPQSFPKEESKPAYEIESIKDFMKNSEEDVLQILETFNIDLKKKYFIRGSQPHAVNILYCAIEAGYLDVVMHLIEDKKMNGYNVCGWLGNYEKFGENALNVAAKFGHLKIVKYLMEERKIRGYYSNSYDGGDVLHAAVRSGHLDIVRYLAEDRHIDIYLKTSFHEDALSIAISCGKSAIRDYLEGRKKITPVLKRTGGEIPSSLDSKRARPAA